MKFIFRVIRWPLFVRLSAIGLALLGCAAIVLGIFDPVGMELRGHSSSVVIGVALLAIGIPAWFGVRLLVWLCGLLLAVFSALSMLSIPSSDKVGALAGVVGLIVLLLPAFSILRHEIFLKKAEQVGTDAKGLRPVVSDLN